MHGAAFVAQRASSRRASLGRGAARSARSQLAHRCRRTPLESPPDSAACSAVEDDRDVLCARRSLREGSATNSSIAESAVDARQARNAGTPLLQSAAPFIDGCACLLRRNKAQRRCVRTSIEVDYSARLTSELHPLTISTVLSIRYEQQLIRFHSQLPPELQNGTYPI